MFKKINPKQSWPEMEEKVLKFWKKNKIFKKSLERNKNKPAYNFYDGPPFATGLPHYGHIVASVMKDAVPRYWTMRGYKVERKWGWDCHGLPIENIVEKELGSKNKKDIEKLGVKKFNETCRGKVLNYADDWKKIIERLGRWVDMENGYKTMDLNYMESVWWIFKQLYEKGLIYEGYKPMHICPRCETTLAQSEVAEGYKDIKDLSCVVKFEMIDPFIPSGAKRNEESRSNKAGANSTGSLSVDRQASANAQDDKTYILAWTTTPWTLIGNVALAINPSIKYVKIGICHSRESGNLDPRVKPEDDKKEKPEDDKKEKPEDDKKINSKAEYYILAKNRLKDILKDKEYKIIKEFKGKDLIGKNYNPLFNYYHKDKKLKNYENGWKIYGADFVTTEEGTGVVHIAPAFGEDDMKLGEKENLPFVQHIEMDGIIKKEAGDFAGLNVKPAEDYQKTDIEIIKYLVRQNLLFSKEKYEHSYPHCWRCETPLLNYASSSWFVNVSKIKQSALKLAKEINWSPEHIKEGRFGNWLESAHDWSISRQRFWASVIPIWKCDKCGEKKVIGSTEEINKKLGVFFVMRHGEAESNVKDIISCQPGGGYYLTKKGIEDVKKTAKKLRKENIEIILSSDIERTKQTAEIVAKELAVKIIFDKRLREVDAGDLDGKKFNQEKWWKEFKAKFPNGDSPISLKERVSSFYNEMFIKYKGKRVLIVSHGGVITSLEAILSRRDYLVKIDEIFFNNCIKKAELRKLDYKLIDLHKHIVDKITFKCEKCGEIMRRVPDVLDCWFESGAMPYAQMHYPFENKEKFKESFPADFIAEGIDQTRTWFYYLHVIATAIQSQPAFKNVIVNGIVLAEDGKKMSKRLKNYPDPMLMFNKYGADMVRFYLLSSPVVSAQNLNFSEKELAELARGMFRMLWNSYSFFVLYANIDKFTAHDQKSANKKTRTAGHKQISNILDRWIVSEWHMLVKKVNKHMESYRLHKAARLFPEFIDNLSNWYIRRSRKRFWKSENDKDKNQAYQTLHYILVEFSKLLAPFAPFVAEEIYGNLANGHFTDTRDDSDLSVHLKNYPKTDKKLIDEKLNGDMNKVREIVNQGLQLRSKAGIKVRQPLSALNIKYEIPVDLLDIIKEEVNVKNIAVNKNQAENVDLNTEITEDLKLEGQAREIIRFIQQMRKEADYEIDNRIRVHYNGMSEVFRRFGNMIAKETLAEKISEDKIKNFDIEKEFEIEKEKIKIQIKRREKGGKSFEK